MTTTYCAVAAPIAKIFKINDDLMSRALDGLTTSNSVQRPNDKNNPMVWIAGHVAETRAVLLRVLGKPLETQWGELFGRGAKLQEAARYPSLDEIKRVAGEINRKLYATLEAFDDEQLARPAKGLDLPNAETVADQIAFFAMHDSYHVGQMAYVRKGLGYPPIAG